jgi:uncharacterized protein (DUF1800 family)
MDGSVKVDAEGHSIELFDNGDITGLAKVFTGLNLDYETAESLPDDQQWRYVLSQPMTIDERYHSTEEKSFLGMTIPADTQAQQSIDLALTHIMAQPSVAPFISRQLIQRLVTSHPSPEYIERVANAFENGVYTLPNGQQVGTGKKGDLRATVAAILMDSQATSTDTLQEPTFGKVREPIIRFVHWARAFNASEILPEFMPKLWDVKDSNQLGQHPYRSPSVFNFFRPGYQAPGSVSGEAGMTAPELQLVSATSLFGYANFMFDYISGRAQQGNLYTVENHLAEDYSSISGADDSFHADYSAELALANDPQALIDHLDLLLTAQTMTTQTKAHIVDTLNDIPLETDTFNFSGDELRVIMGIFMTMTSADYVVQK